MRTTSGTTTGRSGAASGPPRRETPVRRGRYGTVSSSSVLPTPVGHIVAVARRGSRSRSGPRTPRVAAPRSPFPTVRADGRAHGPTPSWESNHRRPSCSLASRPRGPARSADCSASPASTSAPCVHPRNYSRRSPRTTTARPHTTTGSSEPSRRPNVRGVLSGTGRGGHQPRLVAASCQMVAWRT